jgi:hypothetical protein
MPGGSSSLPTRNWRPYYRHKTTPNTINRVHNRFVTGRVHQRTPLMGITIRPRVRTDIREAARESRRLEMG